MIGFSKHDHAQCIESGLHAAEEHCKAAGVQLTASRRRVLEILLHEHRAMGAYDILEILRQDGGSAQPPVAYRALDFLVAQRLVHRIEKLNAFIACTHPGSDHLPAFLICKVCKNVAESQSENASGALRRSAEISGFAIESTVMEAEGICPNCRDEAST